MTKVLAGITTSLDGYITGPNDGPEMGLGEGGKRLHYWVFGGPWSYDSGPKGEATGADKEFLEDAMRRVGAVIGGRGTYEAADQWGGSNPWPVPFFILTHHPHDEPQDLRVDRRLHRRGVREPLAKRFYLLGGLVFCSCGTKMHGTAQKSRGKEWLYYVCPVAEKRRSVFDDEGNLVACHARRVRADEADAFVRDALRTFRLPAR